MILAAAFALALSDTTGGKAVDKEPNAEIIATSVICKQAGRYIGWPTVAATGKGELLVVFSGDRDAHVCPWGKTQMVRSKNGGQTWSGPITVNNTPLDDRDAGIIETRKGTLLVSWFTSLAFGNQRVLTAGAPGHLCTRQRFLDTHPICCGSGTVGSSSPTVCAIGSRPASGPA